MSVSQGCSDHQLHKTLRHRVTHDGGSRNGSVAVDTLFFLGPSSDLCGGEGGLQDLCGRSR